MYLLLLEQSCKCEANLYGGHTAGERQRWHAYCIKNLLDNEFHRAEKGGLGAVQTHRNHNPCRNTRRTNTPKASSKVRTISNRVFRPSLESTRPPRETTRPSSSRMALADLVVSRGPAITPEPATPVISDCQGSREIFFCFANRTGGETMADQRSRGGQKQVIGKQPNAQQKQSVQGTQQRPAEGQPGGPKQKGKSGRDQK